MIQNATFQFDGHHFGVSLNPRPLRAIGALGGTEQELDGWSTTGDD